MRRKDSHYYHYDDDDDNEGLKSQHYFKNVNQKDTVYIVLLCWHKKENGWKGKIQSLNYFHYSFLFL